MRRLNYNAIFFCLFLVLAIVADTRSVNADSDEIIRVAYPIQNGLTEKDASGNYYGYTYEYLMTLAQYAGLEYEFVEVPGDEDTQLLTLMEMLKNGEVDLMGAMIYSERLGETYDYIMNNYGTYSKVLCTLDTNTDLNSVSVYTANKLRVAIYSRSQKSSEELLEYARAAGFEIEEIFVDSEQEQMEALTSGKADVMLTNTMAISEHYFDRLRIVIEFDTQPFYFAAAKGNKDLVNKVNGGISAINATDPYYTTSLKRKYFENQSQKIAFTDEEKAYIEDLEPLKVLILGGRAPIVYTDYQGEPKGIALDLLQYIAEESGISLQIETAENFEEYQEAILNQSPDLLICNSQYSTVLESDNYKMSMPCVSSPLMIVVNSSLDPAKLAGKKLAMPDGIRYKGEYQGKVTYFGSVAECIAAVDTGEADYCYANNYTVQYYTNNNKYHNIYSYQQGEEWEQKYSFAIKKNLGITLQAILNKSIQNISEEELLRMYLSVNGTENQEITFFEFVQQNKTEAVLGLLALAAFITSGGLLCKRHLEKKSHAQLVHQAERDGLTGAYNHAAMREKTVGKLKEMAAGEDRALIIIDLDRFKSINDNYGHYVGDQALKKVMEVCRQCFSDGELIGRIGGDEFAIFAANGVRQDQLELKCQDLRKQLAETKFPEGDLKITLSMGGVISGELNSYDELFKVADRVMYQVKHSGRDGNLFERV